MTPAILEKFLQRLTQNFDKNILFQGGLIKIATKSIYKPQFMKPGEINKHAKIYKIKGFYYKVALLSTLYKAFYFFIK